jgi:uncharacterized membrane protein
MNNLLLYAVLGLIMLIIDIPWLYINKDSWTNAITNIQGGVPARFDMRWGLLAYYALGYILNNAKNIKDAFLNGMATYLIFDATNLALFKNYPLGIAIADTLWGGVLFAITFIIKQALHI